MTSEPSSAKPWTAPYNEASGVFSDSFIVVTIDGPLPDSLLVWEGHCKAFANNLKKNSQV